MQDLHERVFAQSPDLLAVLDREGRYVLANPAYTAARAPGRTLEGLPSREVVGDEYYRARPGQNRVLFSVEDTGPGIPDGELGHVFERFRRGTASYRGTGLGLTIARALVEAEGGAIEVRSRLGEGSIFTIAIPAALAP